MVFLHLADLHIGKNVNEFDMIPDQRDILEKILAIADEKHADSVLIAGDIYDRSIPSETAVSLLDWFLKELASRHIRVFAITGNHDSDERMNFGTSFFTSRGVFLTALYRGTMTPVTVQDEYGPVDVWMLPFVRRSQVAQFHPQETIADYDAAVRAALADAEINPDRRNIILSHQYVTAGGTDPRMSGSENDPPENVGAVEKVDVSAFDAFDYAALGHIHRPQKVGRDTVRYSGSPLSYSLSEIGQAKSVPVVTVGAKRPGDPVGECVTVEKVPLVPLRGMRRIRGKIEDLLKPENITDTDDYLQVILTNEETVPGAMARIQSVYPHTMELRFDNSRSRDERAGAARASVREKTPEEIIRDFYHIYKGGEMSGEEWEILRRAAQKAEVLHEAD
ncbi:MAG: exonuclease SbcCD subunit D [Lachnospiraceae bacterium]